MAKTLSGGERLRKWMRDHDAKQRAVAVAAGVTRVAVYGWLRGDYLPGPVERARIEAFTNGAVPATAWLTRDELAQIGNVRPFAANE